MPLIRTVTANSEHAFPVAWRVNAWRRAVSEPPMSRIKFYLECGVGRIKTVKLGSATLVTTPPRQYIKSLMKPTVAKAT